VSYITRKLRSICPRTGRSLGMLPGLLVHINRIYDAIAELLEASNMTFCFKGPWLSGTDILITVDPANIRYILSSNFDNYPKGTEFKQIFEVLGDSIFNVDSELWEDMRNSSHAIFSHQDFQRFWVNTSVSKLNQGLVPILENAVEKNIIVDLQDLFHRFLFDTSSILITGYDPGCLSIELPKVNFSDAVDGVADGLFYRHAKPVLFWKLQYWIGVGVEKSMRRGIAVFDEMLEKIISAKREEIKIHGIRDSEGEAMDVLTYYMTIDTTKVDDNWKIVISIYALGRMKSVWGDDAEDFRPERWISDNGMLRHEPSHKFLAFSAGPRSCLGKKLTFLQIKTVAVKIIQKYEIEVVEGQKSEPVPSVLLRMQHGLKVSVTRI
ncbi:hypothetical protein HID58_080027, partial [Brassica napus]